MPSLVVVCLALTCRSVEWGKNKKCFKEIKQAR